MNSNNKSNDSLNKLKGYETLAEILQTYQAIEDKGITIIENETNETYISYKSLCQKALKRLYTFQVKGIKTGSEIILQVDNVENFIVSFWAGLLGGFTIAPLTVRAADENFLNLLEILKQMENPYLVTDTDILTKIETYADKNNFNPKEMISGIKERTVFIKSLKTEEHFGRPCERSREDIAFIQYSSGSTGKPKGIVLTHENILSNIDAIIKGIDINTLNSSLSWMPLTHDMGLIGFHLVPLAVCRNHYIMPVSLFVRRPLLWLTKASEHKISVLGSPDFGIKFFLSAFKPEQEYHWDLSSVRLFFNGAEPIHYSLCKKFVETLKKYNLKENCMFPVYGLAEASLAVTFPKLQEGLRSVVVNRNKLSIDNRIETVEENTENNGMRFVDVGYPVAGCQVKIVDSNGNNSEENKLGRIFIKGKNITRSYYKDEIQTNETITKDGWLNTGDLGFLQNGRLIVTGRERDILFVNGQNVYLHDLERLGEEVEGIKPRKIAVCSIYNPVTQEEDICAFVVNRRNLNAFVSLSKRLINHINQKIGIPIKYVIPVEKLPTSTSGKLMRHILAQKYQDGEFLEKIKAIQTLMKQNKTDAQKQAISTIEKNLLTIVSKVLGIDDIDIHDNLSEHGADSIKLQHLRLEVEKIYPNTVKLIDFFDHTSIFQISTLIAERKRIPGLIYSNNKTNHHNDYRSSFTLSLDEDTICSLGNIAEAENVKTEGILLTLYVDLLRRVTNESTITVNAIIENNTFISFQVDSSEIEFFSDLLAVVNQVVQEKKQLKQNQNTANIKKHDLVLELMVKNEKENRNLIFDYNFQRLSEEKIKRLADSYIRLIRMFVKKYGQV